MPPTPLFWGLQDHFGCLLCKPLPTARGDKRRVSVESQQPGWERNENCCCFQSQRMRTVIGLGPVAGRVGLQNLAEGFEAFEGAQTAGLNALKNRWLGPVAGRVALARPAEACEGGQTAALNALKNRWLGPVAGRVALARPAEAFEGGQTAGLNALKNRWLGPVAGRVALARRAEAFEGGQTAGLKACGSIWGRANGSLGRP